MTDFERLVPLIEPAKKSDTGRELKRFRDIASNPKIEAFDRPVGVVGRELFLFVLNWNSPYWCTEGTLSLRKFLSSHLITHWLTKYDWAPSWSAQCPLRQHLQDQLISPCSDRHHQQEAANGLSQKVVHPHRKECYPQIPARQFVRQFLSIRNVNLV